MKVRKLVVIMLVTIVLVPVIFSVNLSNYVFQTDADPSVSNAENGRCDPYWCGCEHENTIMRPDAETLHEWIELYNNAPETYIDTEIEAQIQASSGTFFYLLPHLNYIPAERDQGSCGNCWVWAGTGLMEIALDVQEGVFDRLSIQYFNSKYNEGTGLNWACCGGWLEYFTDFYADRGFVIPWSNTNAVWADGAQTCSDWTTTVPWWTISTSPSYQITTCTSASVETHGVGKGTAISNIKNVLHQNKALFFAFFLPTGADWDVFFDFWWHQPESAVWNPDYSCGHSWTADGGGHAVLCVGYDDTDPDNSYWIMVNSWGTASGNRSNGIFLVDMDMDYDCWFEDGYWWDYSFYWETMDVTFSVEQQYNISVDSVNPGNGDYGDIITVEGSGATAGVDVNLYWDAVKAWDGEKGFLNSTEAEADGSFEVWFDVPEALNGDHYLWAKDTDTGAATMYEFPFVVDAYIELDPESGLPGDVIIINGYGFSEEVEIATTTFDGVVLTTNPGMPETDDLGSWSATFTVPDVGGVYGDYEVYAEDEDGVFATATFTVGALLSDFSTYFASNQVRMIYPSASSGKPLGRGPASVSDWLASAFFTTKLEPENYIEGLDTDSSFVDQITGYPIGFVGEGIASFGGPGNNIPLYYYEVNKVAPVIYCGIPGAAAPGEPWSQWYRADGSAITESAIGTDNQNDLFLIEVFEDTGGRFVFVAYGIDWKGTYAAGKYFDTIIYPNLASYPYSWIIVKWEDTNMDGFVNNPVDGDTYTILVTGS